MQLEIFLYGICLHLLHLPHLLFIPTRCVGLLLVGEEGESGREGIKDAKEQIYYCSAAMKRDLDERRKKVETRAPSRGRGRASEQGAKLLFAGRGSGEEILMR